MVVVWLLAVWLYLVVICGFCFGCVMVLIVWLIVLGAEVGIIFYYVWFGSFHCSWLRLVCGYAIVSVDYLVYCVGDCVVASCSGLVEFCLQVLLLACGALCLLIVFVLLFSELCVLWFVLLFMVLVV